MTVIAWDGRSLAVDKLGVVNGLQYKCMKAKLLPDGTALAWAGGLSQGQELAAWYESGADRSKWPEFQKDKEDWTVLVVAKPDRTCAFFERLPTPVPVIQEYMAWGSGCDYAMGAMAMGATARKAVEIANQHSSSCGLGITEFYFTGFGKEEEPELDAKDKYERSEKMWDEACKQSDRGRTI